MVTQCVLNTIWVGLMCMHSALFAQRFPHLKSDSHETWQNSNERKLFKRLANEIARVFLVGFLSSVVWAKCLVKESPTRLLNNLRLLQSLAWHIARNLGTGQKGWKEGRKENVLFNDALNTFYLRLYGVRHTVKDHSDSERGNQLPTHEHTSAFITPVVEHRLEWEIAYKGSIRRSIAPWANALTMELHIAPPKRWVFHI